MRLPSALTMCMLFVGTASADSLKGQVVHDLWDTAYLQGSKAGYVHTAVREFERDGVKLYHTTVQLKLKVKRFRQVIQLRMDNGTIETATGHVVGTFMRQYLGEKKRLELRGTLNGNQLDLTLDGTKKLKPAPWDKKVVGLYAQERLLKKKKIKPGDEFSFRSFEPSINLVVTTFVKVKGFEEVELFGGKAKRKLLRVEMKPQKIEKIQLPTLTSWLDKDYNRLRSEVEIPGLGTMLLYRSPKSVALAPGSIADLTDIGVGQYIRLSRRIVNPYQTTSAVYRISIKGDDDPASTFARDTRQTVKNVKSGSFELHVNTETKAKPMDKPGQEFLESSYFINSKDKRVQQLAKVAVGTETDPWRKALRIERWVYRNMRARSHEALATADHVARTLHGDCSEFAMLAAAMCRAVDVPSRTAIGLIYANTREAGPVFAFHMWTEVFVDGRWVPIDATRGLGRVGATHLKITDQSWHETRTLTPLFPVVRVLGRVKIDVLKTHVGQGG